MSVSRVAATKSSRCEASTSRNKEHRPPRASKVLAERNPAVVAVGAWVEGGEDFAEHPCALALLTDEFQAERRRENEESLQRFQDEVRHRVAQVSKMKQKPVVKLDRRIPHWQHQDWTQHVPAGGKLMSVGDAPQQKMTERGSQGSSTGMKQVRLRLAACRMIPHGEMTSDLPGGEWNIRHKTASHMLTAEQEVEEEDFEEEGEEEEGEVKELSAPLLWASDKSQPDPFYESNHRVPRALWRLTEPEELKRQRQSQFLMQRRLYMNKEREQVKENKQHRKHLKKTTRIKAEKERIRLEEEREIERAQQLAEARQKLEERELLILERLKLEEEERAVELQRRRKEEKGKVTARFIEALRAQMKERLSQEKMEPPPLCCCASSFWDSHPDTCANNCVFHNNPKAYAKALHSTMLSLDLQ